MNSAPSVLLVSQTPSVIEAVKGTVEQASPLRLEVCARGERARTLACRPEVSLLLVDLAAGGDAEVTWMLWEVATAQRSCATVVLSDCYQEHQASALLRAGAADCLELPTELPKLAFLLGILSNRLCCPEAGKNRMHWAADALEGVVGEGLSGLLDQVCRVAPQETTVLLTGETGTGKTRLARLIHELSPRRSQPFLVVDCGALASELIESELFGHARGAFTGANRERAGKLAAAGTGTLLLDEINSLPLPLQSKLLRAVDERVFEPVGTDATRPLNARLVVAANVPLEKEVPTGRFRADLYYRLNVVGFFLPPLRERRQSITPLARKFLTDLARRNRPDVVGICAEALRVLEAYRWPGNIRELRNVLERAVALCQGPMVEVSDLPESIRTGDPPPRPHGHAVSEVTVPSSPVTLHQSNEEAELRRILDALRRNQNNRLRTALELGISRMGLYKKLHKHGLIESTRRIPQQQNSNLAG
jgi:DNA-binding NtrC family response regulator